MTGASAEMVMGELAGAYEAPIYGMLEVDARIDAHDWGRVPKPVVICMASPTTKPSRSCSGMASGRSPT